MDAYDVRRNAQFESAIDGVDITNDFMFSFIMRKEDICIELLEYLLPDRKIEHIEYLSVEEGGQLGSKVRPETQKTMLGAYDKRSVRLDAYLDDGKTIYNIEMQTAGQEALAQRARLYQAHIDINQLERGMNYDQLKPSFVIFICKFDPFGRGFYRYSFRNMCEETQLALNDGAHKLFFNTAGSQGQIAPKLRELLAYMNDTRSFPVAQSSDKLIRRIDREVSIAKRDDEWRRAFMTYQIHQRDAELRGIEIGRAEGRMEGRAEGRAEGRMEGRAEGGKMKAIETARRMLLKKLPLDLIVEISGLSPDEVLAIQAQDAEGSSCN